MIQEKEKQYSQVMIALSLASIVFYLNKNYYVMNATPIFMYIIIIINIYINFSKNEVIKTPLKYIALITASISATFAFSSTASYLYISTVYSILISSYKNKKIFISANIAAFIIPAILISLPTNNIYLGITLWQFQCILIYLIKISYQIL